MLTEKEKADIAELSEKLEGLPSDTHSYISGVLDGLRRAEELKAEALTE